MRVDGDIPVAAFPHACWSTPEEIVLGLKGTALSVRRGLDTIVGHRALASLGEEARGTLWIVLAEVLNNVVEHAYADHPGTIRIRLWRSGTSVAVEVIDRGLPMPGLDLPEGRAPVPPAPADLPRDLPEGSYGWYLIRALTDWLDYARIGDTNRLRFAMGCA